MPRAKKTKIGEGPVQAPPEEKKEPRQDPNQVFLKTPVPGSPPPHLGEGGGAAELALQGQPYDVVLTPATFMLVWRMLEAKAALRVSHKDGLPVQKLQTAVLYESVRAFRQAAGTIPEEVVVPEPPAKVAVPAKVKGAAKTAVPAKPAPAKKLFVRR